MVGIIHHKQGAQLVLGEVAHGVAAAACENLWSNSKEVGVVIMGAAYTLQTALEHLLAVHLLFYRAARDEAVHNHVLRLPHTVAAIHCLRALQSKQESGCNSLRTHLRIHRRVPRGVEYDHPVCAVERDAHAAALRGQQEHVDGGVCVEGGDS